MSTDRQKGRYLSTYYFHGQDLCIVPRHVREDVAWMAEHQVDGVFVGMTEGDLLGGNSALVCDIIREAGLDVWLIPSRVGGLVAGWGRNPSFLSVEHPEWWGRNADGSSRASCGPQLSVFHPEVPAAVAEVVSRMLRQCPATGIVWDEIKTVHGEDYSPSAIRRLGRPAGEPEIVEATAGCFSQINRFIKQRHPDLNIACFLYSFIAQSYVDRCAAIDLLDQFGCDGKCFFPGEMDVPESAGGTKVLLGGLDARFAAAAEKNGCIPFTLLETQLLDWPAIELTLQRLPEYLASKEGHLSFYYYPYGMAEPERAMKLLGEQLALWRTTL